MHRKDDSKRGTYEVNADSGDIAFCVGIVGKSKQQARLSNTGVSDKEEFEEVVVSSSIVRDTEDGP